MEVILRMYQIYESSKLHLTILWDYKFSFSEMILNSKNTKRKKFFYPKSIIIFNTSKSLIFNLKLTRIWEREIRKPVEEKLLMVLME